MQTMETPELDKVKAVQDKSQIIGEFLDWLSHEKNYHIAEFHEHSAACYNKEGLRLCGRYDDELKFVDQNTEQLLAEYFDIDLKKMRAEQDALFAEVRKMAA